MEFEVGFAAFYLVEQFVVFSAIRVEKRVEFSVLWTFRDIGSTDVGVIPIIFRACASIKKDKC
jgi:hypothetical protein